MSTKLNEEESEWTESAGRSLLRLGKNVAIAGVAISVAPVLVPPLLFISAFGFALSVPFSIYYAGVVGTERLLGSLLPLGQDEVSNENEACYEDSAEDDEKGFGVEQEDDEENREVGEKNYGVEQQDEDITGVPFEGDAWRKTVIDVDDGIDECEIRTKEVEIKPIKVKNIVIEGTKERTEKVENQEAERNDLEEPNKAKTTTNKSDEAKGENGSSGFSSDLSSTVDDLDKEELYSKKQLWEQVRALRIIVGYKAPIGKNLPDEMRALYQFTGVELPLTARDASNIMDLNYKLHFLKNVVGVK